MMGGTHTGFFAVAKQKITTATGVTVDVVTTEKDRTPVGTPVGRARRNERAYVGVWRTRVM